MAVMLKFLSGGIVTTFLGRKKNGNGERGYVTAILQLYPKMKEIPQLVRFIPLEGTLDKMLSRNAC